MHKLGSLIGNNSNKTLFGNLIKADPKLSKELHILTKDLIKGGLEHTPINEKYDFSNSPGLTPGALAHAEAKDQFINKNKKQQRD